ncbi:MAG: NTP transferase domain-containing protein [Candidatus Sericytochromatia bacterium]|nr:NTP transferase domain-containing protein [Candidatus Sericytochromatia bacterium]
MKGIILAGGTGSRLFPLTKVTNKHLLPVGKEPMIFHPLRKLIEAGIEEILIVTGVEHMGAVIGLLGSGYELGCRLTYRVQDQPGGIAQALALAEHFAAHDLMTVILGDNIFQSDLKGFIRRFEKQGSGARILLKQVPDPTRYGVVAFQEVSKDGQTSHVISDILEKPEQAPSDYAVTGIYGYDAEVFEIIRGLKPSTRNELEITEVNRAYLHAALLQHEVMPGWWTDAGTFDSWYYANSLMFQPSLLASENAD